MSSTYHFGRGESGTLNDLKNPKEYHYTDTSYKEAKKCGNFNTVGDRATISKDVQKIKNGEAKSQTINKGDSQTTRFTLNNGRSYGVGSSGTLYPEKGPKLQQLNKPQTRALGTLNDHGLSEKSQDSLRKQGTSQADTKVAVNVWQQNKGKDVEPKKVKNWQSDLERKSSNEPSVQKKSSTFPQTNNTDKTRGR
jgi:hypothetical protein